jgi:RNA polymerase sigma-70 factor (ECF subfamily)
MESLREQMDVYVMQGHVNRLLDHLRRVAEFPRSDGELLTCFIERREENAFEALLRRHGPMVFGVCNRILRNAQDAEDAFQATFLILVRKANSVRPREAVGNWLYGVAFRTAQDCRRRIARQKAKERQVVEMPQPEVKEDDGWRELLPLLDRELHRLPDKYRLAVILCDVEGRSRKEVARQLAVPEGTLSSRLATARKRLAARLARYGFVVSGASLATLLTENAASAFVPVSLVSATTRAAIWIAAGQAAATGVVSATVAALTEGVLKTMFLAKIKTASVLLFGVGVLGLGTGGLLYQSRAGAFDSPHPTGRAIASRPAGEAAQEPGRKRAEDARDREQLLREELEKARQEVEKLRADAEAQRKRAEEAALAARAQRDKALQAERAARQQAEEVRYAEGVRKAAQEFNRAVEVNPGRFENQKRALAELDRMEARLREDFRQQMKKLEEQHRKALDQLRLKRNELLGRNAKQVGNEQPDKLDRILERLERLEKRLDNLEGRRNSRDEKKP